MTKPPPLNVKASAQDTLDSLPDDATWDDVLYRMYVRQRIEAGLQNVEANEVLSVEEVRQRFGLPQ